MTDEQEAQPGEQELELTNPLQEGHEANANEGEQYPSAEQLGDDDAGPDEGEAEGEGSEAE